MLGWTVSGQMCLDRIGEPVHVSTRCTAVQQPIVSAIDEKEKEHTKEENLRVQILSELRTTTCQNYFKVKENLKERSEEKENNVYKTTPEDDEVSMSWEDRQFIQVMEKGIHRNEAGNWEMPLPFRSQNVTMPNNREQAMNRLQSLLRTFKRRPQMEKDYLEFLGKVIERGHAVPVQEVSAAPGKVWYLPHFGIYHPKKPD